MPNLPRRHIESRRTERGLFVIVAVLAALVVAGVIGSVLVDLYAGLATAVGDVLTHTPGR
ncbi:hypothetical protein GPA27_13590 [Aromatoleum toluolicum]|uniref:Uncharacterized protein n=1 Tax=Aromatoleum toluolicum TaxID=90060 RepID=A0ABX1NGN6_9RHOO|nr:hypothetical protein [Aromatoleum toluolicum]NMF98419.1 hypothetical protein [Aromatoleum toluolicum]